MKDEKESEFRSQKKKGIRRSGLTPSPFLREKPAYGLG